jgi:hypothetical protein
LTFLPSTVTSSPAFLPLQASATGSIFLSYAKAMGVTVTVAKTAANSVESSLLMIDPLLVEKKRPR